MFMWLKRWLYGCNHDWQFVTKFNTFENDRATRSFKTTSIHRCCKCMKVRKDVFK